MGYSISKFILRRASCRSQRDGVLIGVLPAWGWDLLEQCVLIPELPCFPGSCPTRLELLFCTAQVVSGHVVQYSFPCPQYPASGFDACRVWSQCCCESLCASQGMGVIVLQALSSITAQSGGRQVFVSLRLSWLLWQQRAEPVTLGSLLSTSVPCQLADSPEVVGWGWYLWEGRGRSV